MGAFLRKIILSFFFLVILSSFPVLAMQDDEQSKLRHKVQSRVVEGTNTIDNIIDEDAELIAFAISHWRELVDCQELTLKGNTFSDAIGKAIIRGIDLIRWETEQTGSIATLNVQMPIGDQGAACFVDIFRLPHPLKSLGFLNTNIRDEGIRNLLAILNGTKSGLEYLVIVERKATPIDLKEETVDTLLGVLNSTKVNIYLEGYRVEKTTETEIRAYLEHDNQDRLGGII